MIAIFSTQDSSRLRFVLSFIFEQYFVSGYQLFQSENEFALQKSYKINYSHIDLAADLTIVPNNEIFEKDAKILDPICFEWKNTKAFFKTSENEIPFDIFFAIFYLISRYEEYLPHQKDTHGRYISSESMLYKKNILEIPIVNIWLFHLVEIIPKKEAKISIPKFQFIPTLDIDQFFYFKHKGFKRQLGSLLKDFITFRWKNAFYKKMIWLGLIPDFYDNNDEIISLHKNIKVQKVFILSSKKTTLFDKNINPKKQLFKEKIKQLSTFFSIGIHPSYFSNSEENKILENEINLLQNILQKDVKDSRQHFLKMEIPETYRQLILQKIEMDHTMGYAENIGYKAGVAFPFYFFDIEKNEATTLKILPFMVMDVTLKNYLKLNPEQAKNTIENLLKDAKKYGGIYSSIWHNESLSEHGEWKNWKQVYTYLLEKI